MAPLGDGGTTAGQSLCFGYPRLGSRSQVSGIGAQDGVLLERHVGGARRHTEAMQGEMARLPAEKEKGRRLWAGGEGMMNWLADHI